MALVYNWWSWYCRAAKPGVRMEAITSRALLLAGVGRAVKHAGQTTLYLTPMHVAIGKLMALIANIRAALSHVRSQLRSSCQKQTTGGRLWTMWWQKSPDHYRLGFPQNSSLWRANCRI